MVGAWVYFPMRQKLNESDFKKNSFIKLLFLWFKEMLF